MLKVIAVVRGVEVMILQACDKDLKTKACSEAPALLLLVLKAPSLSHSFIKPFMTSMQAASLVAVS